MDFMDFNDERDDLADDEATAHRARAATMLDQIACDAKEALADQNIAIDLFFLVPNSGEAVLIYGTPGDPDDGLWNRVREIVGSIVAESIGLDRVQCRQVMCAATDSIADHQRTDSPAQPPSPTPALQHVGADQ
jgi:hypothetical protein